MSIEWRIPDISEPVRQGDLLIQREEFSRSIRTMGLVITADCDIGKGKFGSQLLCLRVVSLVEYVRTHWAGRKLKRTLDVETRKTKDQLARWHTRMVGTRSGLTEEAARAWVLRASADAICDELSVPHEERHKVCGAIDPYHRALKAIVNGRDAFDQLMRFQAARTGRECRAVSEDLLAQMAGETWPDDAFMLTTVPQLEMGAAVVLLRDLIGIPINLVTLAASDVEGSLSFLRIGRLEPTYKYAVSQAFAYLYSRIGLPEAYENRCREVLEQLRSIEWVQE